MIRCSFFLIFFSFVFCIQATPVFIQDQAPSFSHNMNVDVKGLCEVADNTHSYIKNFPEDNYAVHSGLTAGVNVSLLRVKQTLDYVCDVYHEDVKDNVSSRLNDAEFLKQHFEFILWQPDKAKANQVAKQSTNEIKTRLLKGIPEDSLLLTKYYTKLLTGSESKTAYFSQALYKLPHDEQGLSLEQAEDKKTQLTRFKYTRQQIIQGALLKHNLAKPLIWVSEEALHDVLLQGTGVLKVNGETRYFNVHRNNGIAYDYHIGKREQARYWYFSEVPSILGYGKNIEEKIPLVPYVSLAGNVKQLGIGKLVLLSYQARSSTSSHLAILADEGGAFDDNLFQLDHLVGSYHGWKDYHQANKHLPDYAKVWIMVVKEPTKM